jgi:hypothetical protein
VPLTIAFDNITVRTSLNAICESAGLRWSLVESERPAINLRDADFVRLDGRDLQQPYFAVNSRTTLLSRSSRIAKTVFSTALGIFR